MTLKVVDFPGKNQDQIDPAILQRIKDQTATLIKAAEENRLSQVMLQFEIEEDIPDSDGDTTMSTIMMFWNDNGCFDRIIGYASRFKMRLLDIAESMIGQE